MSRPADDRVEWPDERLEAAFRARFAADPPHGLADRIRAEIALSGAPRTKASSWRSGRLLEGWGISPLGGVAALAVLIVAASVLWLGTVRTPPAGSHEPTAVPRSSDQSGRPWPTEITLPGAQRPQPVISVAEAIGIRDADASAREVTVGGWYTFNPVPCPALPDPTSPLEDCAVDFTWLMAAPEQLHELASDGSGSIHPPAGPGINAVLAYVDWSSPSGDRAIPVVFVGHFHDRRAAACPAGDRKMRCETRFVVDSILWTSDVRNDLAAAPGTAFGLPVTAVSDAIQARGHGSTKELAVRGWYWAPGVMSCPALPISGVPFLEPGCGIAFTWLMEDPESLMSGSDAGRSMHGPSGAAVQPVFAGATPPTLSIETSTALPVPVVFVGHFNDRRSRFCTAGASPSASEAACRARFVVDAVAWVNGAERPREVIDLREGTDPQPSPWLDPLRNFTGDGSVLGEQVLRGDRIGEIEPELTKPPMDLSAEPSLWVVTVLDPDATVRTLVFTVRCEAFQDSGPGFVALPLRCLAVLQSAGPS